MHTDDLARLLAAVYRFRRQPLHVAAEGILQYSELLAMTLVAQRPEHCGRLTTAEFRQRLQVSQPAVSQILKGLEGKGYILRGQDAQNRRKLHLSITAAGQAALDEALAAYEQFGKQVQDAFSPEEMSQFVLLIDRFLCVARGNEDSHNAQRGDTA